MAKVSGVKFGEARRRESQTTMRLDRDVADVIRRVARYEGRKLDELMSDMLAVYCKKTHPNLELIWDDNPEDKDDQGL